MNQFLEWLRQIFSSWKFWIVIAPWDIGVRIRLGKVAAALKPGLHLRIPVLDEITLVNTRLRIEPTPTVTVSGTRGGQARVITAQVGYLITDPVGAMLRYNHPGSAVLALAQSKIAERATAESTRMALNEEFQQHGIEVVYVYYTEDVEVKTYRLLQNGGAIYSNCATMPAPGGVANY